MMTIIGYILIFLSVVILISSLIKEKGKTLSDVVALITFAVIVFALGLFLTNYNATVNKMQAENKQQIVKYHKQEIRYIKHLAKK